MLKRQKELIYCMVRKLVFQRWILAISAGNKLVVTLFCVENIRSGLIIVGQMCLGRSDYFYVKMSV